MLVGARRLNGSRQKHSGVLVDTRHARRGKKVNQIEAEVFNRTAAAIVGTATPKPAEIEKKLVILATQFGNTTHAIIRAKDYLTDRGYDFTEFHAIGKSGGG